MGGVAEEGDAAVGPSGQRVAVDHGVFVEGFGGADQAEGIDEAEAVELEVVLDEGEQVFHAARAAPVLAAGGRGGAVGYAGLDDPVGEAGVGAGGVDVDGVEDEFGAHAAGDEHCLAVGEDGPFDGAAPEHDAGPAWGAFVDEGGADGGMDAVGADQGCAAGRGAVFEAGGDAVFVLFEGQEAVGCVDGDAAGEGGFVQDGEELAAVDAELGGVVAGVGSAQLGPDGLAEAVGEDEFPRADADGVQGREEAEGCEFADGVGEGVDADAEFADGGGLFIDGAGDAGLVQREGRGQAADAAAGEEDHLPPSTAMIWPLTKSARGLAKKTTALAMSSGVPMRRMAMRPTSAAWPSLP